MAEQRDLEGNLENCCIWENPLTAVMQRKREAEGPKHRGATLLQTSDLSSVWGRLMCLWLLLWPGFISKSVHKSISEWCWSTHLPFFDKQLYFNVDTTAVTKHLAHKEKPSTPQGQNPAITLLMSTKRNWSSGTFTGLQMNNLFGPGFIFKSVQSY